MQGADPETVSWGRFALASVTVVGLLSLTMWGLKTLIQRGWIKPRSSGGRLHFVSSLPLDSRRRLVLTRCDDKEYLLLLGANNDLLLSSASSSSKSDTPE